MTQEEEGALYATTAKYSEQESDSGLPRPVVAKTCRPRGVGDHGTRHVRADDRSQRIPPRDSVCQLAHARPGPGRKVHSPVLL